jgi:hypothetical protein
LETGKPRECWDNVMRFQQARVIDDILWTAKMS